jgi:hypothetical protein
MPAGSPAPSLSLFHVLVSCRGKRRDECPGVVPALGDVYCWKGEAVAFAEVKHRDNDQIRPDQRTWIEAALGVGVPLASLLIAEWEFSG